jgi:hypothetical protein
LKSGETHSFNSHSNLKKMHNTAKKLAENLHITNNFLVCGGCVEKFLISKQTQLIFLRGW